MSFSTSALPEERQHSVSGGTINPPLPFSQRIQSLDVLRGIGILGGLFTSILLFGGFSTNRQRGLLTSPHGGNYQLFRVVNILLEGKMMALIAIVFGASMLLYLFKDKQTTQLRNADSFMRRQLWLIAFGLVNAFVFLWSGDALFHLGIMGVLLFSFSRLSPRSLVIAALFTALIFCGKYYWNYTDDRKVYTKYLVVAALEKKIKKDTTAAAKTVVAGKPATKDSTASKQTKDTLTKKQMGEKIAWEGLVKRMKFDPKKDSETIKTMQENDYGKIWKAQLNDTQPREAQWTYRFGIWELGSMIFLGMALFKFGFFDTGFSSKKYVLPALGGLAIGFFLGWLRLHHQQLTSQDYEQYISHHSLPYNFFYPIEIACTALGYTSLFLLLLRASFLQPIGRALSKVGQMALSNYLLQSLVCVLFFDGFGMGYFARLQQWQLYLFAAEVVLVNIVFSVFWLRYFYHGPAEWLLRCLVSKSWLPNRKITATAEPVIAI